MELFIVLLLVSFISTIFSQVIIAKNTQVTPRCGSQLISIEVNFDPTQLPGGRFTDWIVVGVSGRPECRLRGNGETKYIIEIAVFNDPCLTQIPAQNVFQNRVRIGKNPVVILEEDQSITVKCIYGLPTVETMTLPIINSNFDIDKFGHSETETRSSNKTESLLSAQIDASLNVDSRERSLQSSENNDSSRIELKTTNSAHTVFPHLLPKQNSNSEHFSISPFGNDLNNKILEESRNTIISTNEFLEKNKAENDDSIGETEKMSDKINNFGNANFGLNSNENSKIKSFSMIFITAVILIIFVLFVLLVFCLVCWRKNYATRNRHLLVNRVSDSKWPATSSGDEYGNDSPRGVRIPHDRATVINSKSSKSNYSDRRTRSLKISRKKTSAPIAGLPLKSNLEEFVSKAYVLNEYNNLASPAYAYTSEIHDEREVDVRPYGKQIQTDSKSNGHEDTAVSSFRSITEIVHAAETATTSKETRASGDFCNMQNVLMDCVLPIRGFGYRKLTEQEIIRWKNLIQQDANITKSLMSSKSSAEIEKIFEHEEYKNMFTSSKWHEIALCVHRTLTNSLDRTNSRSELQLFVGNVQTDW